MEKRILLTAFRNTSAQQLLQDVTDCTTLLLPNDKRGDSQIVIDLISREKVDCIVSFGQRPNIQNKVHIETTARTGGECIRTELDCGKLAGLFEEHGIRAKVSHNAGSSFCNQLYWNCLRYLSQSEIDTRMIFVHIPFAKNIRDFDDFRRKILNVIGCMKEGQI